jgi:hydrogenase maturation protein HypF
MLRLKRQERRSGAGDQPAASRLDISGIVQGVGFRPFIYQLARRYDLGGRVANTAAGVCIHAEGRPEDLERFITAIQTQAPPLAAITAVSRQDAPYEGIDGFTISNTKSGAFRTTLISPDVSVCRDCLAELFDPRDRRYRYPFINCTNCGPRYTIIDDIPYDRPNTSMKHFAMCADCRAEYEDPGNRRFHAQPNACRACGPRIRLLGGKGEEHPCRDPIQAAARLLRKGYILAVKGLGGFHLAVDPRNTVSVERLRRRKQRAEKPFALMSPDTDVISCFARLSDAEKTLLQSPQRPIVLLPKLAGAPISDAVSPDNPHFGVMLPYTPLHYLLLDEGFPALVMTSANISEEPIVIEITEALSRLSGIADYFLDHDRDIYLRSDDSIVRHLSGAPRFLRRSRGYVPMPIFLKSGISPVLACGALLKNTVCLTKADQAFISQHIGDLENTRAYEFFCQTISHMKRILDIEPEIVAHDMHPDYLSTRYALEQKEKTLVPVQHHHAHIVSCMAENQLSGEVIGLSFDGTGYGTDGRIWGGEVLIASPAAFLRPAHLSYVPMPGGEAAIREPWRMGLSYLQDAFGAAAEDLALELMGEIEPEKIRLVQEMAARGINAPLTSSLGRLFDGVAALLGIRRRISFEGQAAMALESRAAAATNYLKRSSLYNFELDSADSCEIPVRSIICGVVRDLRKGEPAGEISTRFHLSLIQGFTEICARIREETALNRVVLSGGVFQNAILFSGLKEGLSRKGFQVYSHCRIPANDGGICLGQAVSAAARLSSSQRIL